MPDIKFSNLDKIFFPELGLAKADVIQYYLEVAEFILPHLKDRPQSLLRYPDGIYGQHFYHKNFSDAPAWIEKIKVENNKIINYLLCQDKFTLAYLINLGCIDLNPWLSKSGSLEKPDFAILDLDPLNVSFAEVRETAKAVKNICDRLELRVFIKTSGATGLHIFIPLGAKYSYDQARNIAQIIAILVHQMLPDTTSLERAPMLRENKVYLDFLQNFAGQTIASVYSVRANPSANVSMPLFWEELSENIDPKDFNIKNAKERLERFGDIFFPVLYKQNDIEKALQKIKEYSKINWS